MATKAVAAATIAAAPSFPVDRLREKSYQLFGVTKSTFDGATYGLDGEYTVDEMRKIIADWQKKEVK